MRSTFKLLFVLALLLVLTTSCGDDAPDCSDEAALNAILEDGFDDVSTALSNYINDQSDSNCNAVVDAYNDWIDDLDNLQGCADDAGQGQEFRDAINESRAALNDFPC